MIQPALSCFVSFWALKEVFWLASIPQLRQSSLLWPKKHKESAEKKRKKEKLTLEGLSPQFSKLLNWMDRVTEPWSILEECFMGEEWVESEVKVLVVSLPLAFKQKEHLIMPLTCHFLWNSESISSYTSSYESAKRHNSEMANDFPPWKSSEIEEPKMRLKIGIELTNRVVLIPKAKPFFSALCSTHFSTQLNSQRWCWLERL